MTRLRSKSWTLTIPVAVIAAAYVWLFFLPDKRAIARLHAEISEKMGFNALAGKLSADARRAQHESEAIEKYVAEWQNISGDPGEIAGVFKSIAEATKLAGVQTTRFVPDSPIKLASIERIPLRLGCRGTLAGTLDLLSRLERLHNRIWIDELTLEPSSQNSELVQCEMVVVVFAGIPEKTN
jgi:hypothetical protein